MYHVPLILKSRMAEPAKGFGGNFLGLTPMAKYGKKLAKIKKWLS